MSEPHGAALARPTAPRIRGWSCHPSHLLLALVLGGCCSSSSEVSSCIPQEPRGDLAGACVPGKLKFTQATGCKNDGFVEFCLPKMDLPSQAQAMAVAADLQCAPGAGRAGCSASELLCQLPTAGARCVAVHGALTDAAWTQVCALSSLPAVREIVPTFFE